MDDVRPNLISTPHIDEDGNKHYSLPNGKTLHREDGPAVEWNNGAKNWYLNGKLHRVDGPAIEDVNGYKAWYINGKLHRVNGPAVDYGNGDKCYFLNGEEYPFKVWNRLRKMLWVL